MLEDLEASRWRGVHRNLVATRALSFLLGAGADSLSQRVSHRLVDRCAFFTEVV